MQLVLDLQGAQSPVHADRGIARYAIGLTTGLLAAGADIPLIALNPALPFPRFLPPELVANPRLTWGTKAAFDAVDGPFAYVSLSPVEVGVPAAGILPAAVRQAGAPLIAVLYDLIPLLFRSSYFDGLSLEWYRYRHRLQAYRVADLTLAISDSSRRDAAEHLQLDPGRLATIWGGVSGFFRPPAAGDPRPKVAGLSGRYTLSVAGDDDRKNLVGVLGGWARLPPEQRTNRQLVITCKLSRERTRELIGFAASIGLGPGEVLFSGLVDDDTLLALYQHAELNVMPSRYEGLGLPVLEALACGCPTVTSSTSSLPEILDLPASTFDPDDPSDIARVVGAGLDDHDLRTDILTRAEERLPLFTWGSTAERALAAIGRLRPPRRRPRRRRVGIVTPLPPHTAGPAVYTGRLLERFADHADISAFEAEGFTVLPPLERVRRMPLASLGTAVRAADLDHLVTVVGNSEHYWHSVESMQRVPSVAWVHDARLPAIPVMRAQHLGEGPEWVRDLAEGLHPGRLPVLAPELWLDAGALARLGIGLTSLVTRWATGLVVQSELAVRLLALDQQPGRALPPTAILPHAFVDPAALPPPQPQHPELVVALGMVDPVKAPDALVSAVGRLRTDLDLRLAFVGPVADRLRARLEQLAIDAGAAGAVTFTGEVDEATYWSWVRRASLGVQLRRTSFGESSGAVCELMAAGVPCLTSVATAVELPSGSVGLLPRAAGVEELVVAMRSLLEDPGRRNELAEAGRRTAARWTYADLARSLLPVLDSLAAARPGVVVRSGPAGATPIS